MITALTFNDVTLSPITYQNSLWIRAVELARALGYSSEKSISNIYNRNQDEFSNEMSVVINLSTTNTPALTRIFSLRGCHLVAMFARTPVAKAFRRWVLDVLEKYAAEQQPLTQPTDAPLTPALRAELKAIVDAKLSTYPASVQGKARAEIWTRFNRHFKIAEYAQLPAVKMPDARDYLIQLSVKALQPASQPAAAPTRPHVPGAEERYLRFLEHLEETRKMISEHTGALSYEAAQLLPKELLQKKQFGNALGWLIRWIMEEITSPMPRGGLLRDDNDSPLYILMHYGK